MPEVQAIISDFGGVLTSPLAGAFAAFETQSGVPLAQLGQAMMAIGARRGANPLFDLEIGRLTEHEFLTLLGAELSTQLGREIDLEGFGERYFADLSPNHDLIDYMRQLHDRGLKLAICTNNVREWETRWRAMVPVDEIFDIVVDSAFVGLRKPDPAIYHLTLERLGTPAAATVFVDDIELNCAAATEVGLRAIWFRSTEQTIADLEAQLTGSS